MEKLLLLLLFIIYLFIIYLLFSRELNINPLWKHLNPNIQMLSLSIFLSVLLEFLAFLALLLLKCAML